MTWSTWTYRRSAPRSPRDQPLGEVESTKSVSDVYSPLAGTVVERNAAIDDRPELVNEQPYGDGWLVVIEPAIPVLSMACLTRPATRPSSTKPDLPIDANPQRCIAPSMHG